jgi:hypothetical protein
MTLKVYQSGFVQRFATNPAMAWTVQTNGHHAWGVAVLVMQLFPEHATLPLLREALLHDAGEMGTCDASSPAKKKYPYMAEVIADAEVRERAEMGVPMAHLRGGDKAILKFCDVLESYLFASVRTPWVLAGDGWPEQRAWLMKEAGTLGVGEKVAGLLA